MSKLSHSFQMANKGFTLIELLISIAIFGIITSAIINTFSVQRQSYALQEQVIEMVQQARAAMEIMTREIRMAGYNPAGVAFTKIVYNPTHIEIRADLNGNGATNEPDEHITYSYDAAQRQILRDTGGQARPLAENIQALTFVYLDSAGAPTTSTAAIRQLLVTIVARTARPDRLYAANAGYRTYSLTSLITPRN